MNLNEYPRVYLSFIAFHWIALNFTEFHRISLNFFENQKKFKNWKYSSGPINYIVSWRSHDLKIYPQLWKIRNVFPLIFHGKSSHNRLKNWIKRWVHYESMKTRSLGPRFGPRLDLGLFWGSHRGPKNHQKSTQSCQIKAYLAWGRPRKLPEPILIDFSMILEWFLGPQMVNSTTF